MTGQVLTEVRARVAAERVAELVEGFQKLAASPAPAGLLRSELLRGNDGVWRVQTLWRDRAALDAMRAAPEPPAAPTLFRSVGAEPTLEILDLVSNLVPES